MTTLTKPRKVLWGGVIEFGDLEPGTYTATAEAWNTDENILEGSGSTKITVRAGETTDCNITMILEGQTAYYSKYMILTNYSNTKYIYDYPSCNKSSKSVSFGTSYSYNTVEDNNGQIYHIKDSNLYKDDDYVLKINDASNLIRNPLYYDSKTDSLWLASFNSDMSIVNFSVLENPSAATPKPDPYTISYDDSSSSITPCQAFAVKEDNIYIAYNNSNILLAKKDTSIINKKANINLSDITPALSGEVTDMAVLEDGTVAVLVRSVGVGNETEGFGGNMSLSTDGSSIVYSRGALVLLSSALSKVEKVIGWTDSPRTISATGTNNDLGSPTFAKTWTSIKAYIPEYEERNSHFYGPVKIVAIRPKELVIADCGANFVLPDYDGKKNGKRNGKMYAHNRLMTVNLRNFAIGCKKEFSESELKFNDLMISGGSTDSYTIQASSSYNACEGEK